MQNSSKGSPAKYQRLTIHAHADIYLLAQLLNLYSERLPHHRIYSPTILRRNSRGPEFLPTTLGGFRRAREFGALLREVFGVRG